MAAAAAYRRDRTTWAAFVALFGFGYLNAALGPALPYLRAAEHSSYLVGSLHQAAFAVGGGLAGLLAAAQRRPAGRTLAIATGLAGAGLAGLAIGYGNTPAITVAAAMTMSLLGTSALIRVWAVLADVHGARRAVAMSEGEVAVSLAGIVVPLLMGGLAAGAATWRAAFVVGAGAAGLAAAVVCRVGMPPAAGRSQPARAHGRRRRLEPTLVIVFAIVGLEFSLSFWLASYLDDDVRLSRGAAVAAVSGLYAANLAGRVVASRLARHVGAERLLAVALGAALLGLPALLAARAAVTAALGIAVAGMGIGALFPLTSALHVKASARGADGALGQVLAVASLGQIAGPLTAGAIAQVAGLRAGLLVLPALTVGAAAGLYAASGRTTARRRRGASAPCP